MSGTARGTASGGGPDVSPLARRVGPLIAVVGLLGGLAVLFWVAVAPDNVDGTVAQGGVDVPATAVVASGRAGCLLVVDGDGSERELCPEGVRSSYPQPRWTRDGRLVASSPDGVLQVDPVDGTTLDADADADVGGDGDGVVRRGAVHVDGQVVRRGPGDATDGEVVLELGGPVGRLRTAAASPDGSWVVAVDEDGRVLVAESGSPREVRLWFATDEEVWFDPWEQVRWDE